MTRRSLATAFVGLVAAFSLVACSDDDPKDKADPKPTDATAQTSAAPNEEKITDYTSGKGVKIHVDSPVSGAKVSSPLSIRGTVPGSWSFEANFPIEIVDANHKSVAKHYATVDGDWMTTDPVGFSSVITFTAPMTDTGFLVLHNANASGEEDQADSVEIPIAFR